MRRSGIGAVALIVVAVVTIATAVPASAGTGKGRRVKAKAKVVRVDQRRPAPSIDDVRRWCADEAARRQWVLGAVKAKIGQASFLDDGQKNRLIAGVDPFVAELAGVQTAISVSDSLATLGPLCKEFAVDRVIWAVYLPQIVYAAQLTEANTAYEQLMSALETARANGFDSTRADALLADARVNIDAIIDGLSSVTPAMLADPGALVAMWDGVKNHINPIVNDLVSVSRLLPRR